MVAQLWHYAKNHWDVNFKMKKGKQSLEKAREHTILRQTGG